MARRPRIRDSVGQASAEVGEAANAVENAANWFSAICEALFYGDGVELEVDSIAGFKIPKSVLLVKVKDRPEEASPE